MTNPYLRMSKNGKRLLVHRNIMEEHLGRKLGDDEDVHHINGNKHDNRLENLVVLSKKKHGEFHSKMYNLSREPKPDPKTCEYCGDTFVYKPKYGRKQFAKARFCSNLCSVRNARKEYDHKYINP